MRILLINYEYPPNGGGAGNATQEIGRALTQMGLTVTVLTGGQASLDDGQDGIEIVRVGPTRRSVFQTGFLYMSAYVFSSMLWVLRQKKSWFDLSIVFFLLPCGPVATLLKMKVQTPYIVSLRGGDVPGLVPQIDLLHRVLAPFRRWVSRNATAVVANSQSLAELAEASDDKSVAVIPNGVDTQYYQARHTDMGVESTPLRLLLVCRFHRQKLVPETIRWLAHAKQRGIDFFISIVGDGPERDAVEAAIEEVDMTELISLKGWLRKDQLLKQYQEADCFLNLSSYEGMPNTVLEAMACALPVIVSDIPPHRGLVKHQETGYLLDLDRPEYLADQLMELASDSGRRRAMAEAGRQLVAASYSWSAVADSYMSLFAQHQTEHLNSDA